MESTVLRCPICQERAIKDALELELKEGSRVLLGCLPCLRRAALRPYPRLMRLPQIVMQVARGLALPWITPTVWLRDALLANGWTTEEFLARQSGRLVATQAGDEAMRAQVARELIVVLRHLAAVDGETTASEWQSLRRAVFAQHVDDQQVWTQVDPGREPLAPPTEEEWKRSCHGLRPLLRGFDDLLMLHWFDVVVHASGGLIRAEREAIERIVAELGLDAKRFAAHFGFSAPRPETTGEFCAYAVLGLEKQATAKEVRRAYLKLAMENHPDRVAHLGPALVEAANERMKQINRAYESLKR